MNILHARDLLLPAAIQQLDVSPFVPITEKIPTMARPRFLALLNSLARLLENDEIFLEVGTYLGGSMVGALLGNSAKAIGVDDFSQFKENGNRAQLELNLMYFGVNERVAFFEMDFHEYFKRGFIPPVGVYYYDGAHDEQNTLDGLELAYPHIVKDGVIVLDDTLYPAVCAGVNRFLGEHLADVKILFAVSPAQEFNSSWWNGTLFLQKVGE